MAVSIGTSVGDTLNGTPADDTFYGEDGNDLLFGDHGNDTLYGGNGNDFVWGGAAGSDYLDGGAGNADVVIYEDATVGVTIDLPGSFATDGLGLDSLIAFEAAHGSSFNDTITLPGGDGHAFGRGGHDVIFGGSGNNNLYAGSGNDSLYGEGGNDNLYGGSGNDSLDGGSGTFDRIYYFDDGNDSAGVSSHGVTADLGAGTAIDNWDGFDSFIGVEAITASALADTLFGGTANDQLFGEAGNDLIQGGDGNDQIGGRAGGDTLYGGNGNDVLTPGSGNDTVYGGPGTLDRANYSDDGFDTAGIALHGVTVDLASGTALDNWDGIDLLSGIEAVSGSNFGDLLTGDSADNHLTGAGGNDTLYGGGGNDLLWGGTGSDYLDGGAGNADVVLYEDATVGVTINLATGFATDGLSVDSLVAVEAANGSSFNDTITLTNSDGRAMGRAGNDTLYGGSAIDLLMPGSGNDTVFGGSGTVDVVSYFDDGFDSAGISTHGVTVDLGAGTALDNWNGIDVLAGIEYVLGSNSFGDTLIGNSADNNLTGAGGNDLLSGGAGLDRANFSFATVGIHATIGDTTVADGQGGFDTLISIEGFLGSNTAGDTLFGDENRNRHSGLGGDDTLFGAGGNDELFGTNGNDLIFGGSGFDYIQGGPGNDTIDGNVGFDFFWFAKSQDFDTVDYLFGTSSGVIVDLAAGTATDGEGGIDNLFNIEAIFGSPFADTLYGGGSARFEAFRPGPGNDTVFGAPRNTRIEYNDATSGVVVTISGAPDGLGTASGGGVGTDILHNVNQFFGSSFADTIDVSAYLATLVESGVGFNAVRSGAGNDSIIGNGYTRLDFGSSTAGITIDLAQSVVGDGLGGFDSYTGVNQVSGTSLSDVMHGTDNTLGEHFRGLGGNDVFFGGPSIDTARYDSGTDPIATGITANLTAGTVVGDPTWVGTDTFSGIEAIVGSTRDDTFIATGFAGGGFDASFRDGPLVNPNYNRFQGLSGNDLIIGNGQTQLDYSGSHTGIVVVFTGEGSGTASGDMDGTDVFSGVYAVTDTPYDDILIGSGATTPGYWEIFNLRNGNDTVVGGAGNDVVNYNNVINNPIHAVFSGQGAATIAGNGTDTFSGIEFVFGTPGNDILAGGTGNETFAGVGGQDTLSGGGGNADALDYFHDRAAVAVDLATGQALDGFGGMDQLSGFEIVLGSVFSDSLMGGLPAETLVGNAGNDSIAGGGGDDSIDGGAGNDSLDGGSGNDALIGGEGNDILVGGEGDDTLAGGGGNDTFFGGPGFGDPGFDTVIVQAGSGIDVWADFVQGKGKFDVTSLGISFFDVAVSNSGSDKVLVLGSGGPTLFLTGQSTITIDSSDFGGLIIGPINGTAGNDTISAPSTADTVFGLAGNDTLYGGPPAGSDDDTLYGAGGDDQLHGLGGNDTLYGGTENDSLVGGVGNDKLFGDEHDDTLVGSEGNDSLNGGTGDRDAADYSNSPASVFVDLADGEAQDGHGGTDQLANIDVVLGSASGDFMIAGAGGARLFGAAGSDILTGGGGDDSIFGGSETDILDGGAGNDSVEGGAGDDVVSGGAGFDALDGGTGDADAVSFQQDTAGVVVDVGAGTALDGFGANDLLLNFELFFGSNHGDTLVGGAGADILGGLAGNDSISGGLGNDLLIGAQDNDAIDGGGDDDSIDGGAGNDSLLGALGNDFLIGGEGDDRLAGGGGNDTFLGGPGSGDPGFDTVVVQAGSDVDVWTDFVQGKGKIDVAALDIMFFNVAVSNSGADKVVVLGSGGPTLILTGQAATTLETSDFNGLITGPINGSAGNDTINAPSTADTVFGLAGNDTLYGGPPAGSDDDTLYGAGGDDKLHGVGGNDTLYGGTENDSLVGGVGNDRLFGDEHDDTLVGSEGNDSLNGGTGDRDAVDYSSDPAGVAIDLAGGTVLDGHGGTDQLSNLEIVLGSAFSDSIAGGSQAETLVGNAGNDSIGGGAGNDALDGGSGNDVVDGGSGNDSLDGALGNDFLIGGEGDDRLAGGGGNDIFQGGPGFGDPGFDTVVAQAGSDVDVWTDFVQGKGKIDVAALNIMFFDVAVSNSGSDKVLVLGSGGPTLILTGHAGTAIDSSDFNGLIAGPIFGSAGNDTISAPSAADTVFGLAGNDTLYGGPPAGSDDDTLYGAGGDDRLHGVGGNDTLYGGTENDSLVGGVGNDKLFGDEHDDTLVGSEGNDSLNGGTGDRDAVDYSNSPAGVSVDLAGGTAQDGHGGTDLLANIDVVLGTAANDVMTGGAGGARLFGAAGGDILTGGGGDDSVFGGSESDALDGGTGNDSVEGGTGNDTLIGGGGHDALDGGAGNDSLLGALGNDLLIGGEGDDRLAGGGGNDIFQGGPGSGDPGFDTVVVQAGSDVDVWTDFVQGKGKIDVAALDIMFFNVTVSNSGADKVVVLGSGGPTLILTGHAATTLETSDFNGLITGPINGSAGNDTINAPPTADTVFGLAGNDTLYGGPPAGSDDDTLYGAGGDDQLHGLGGNDTLYGGTENDSLVGGVGNDKLFGDEHDDTLVGSEGNDSLNGGTGDRDAADYSNSPAGVLVDLAAGTAQDGHGGTDLLANIDVVLGSAASDVMTGGAGGARLFGAAGGDILTGGGGDDTVVGGSETDILDGGAGNDLVEGGAGDDVVSGAAGSDTLDGGTGGADAISFGQDAAGVVVDVGAGTALDGSGANDLLLNFELVFGSNHADTLFGAAGADILGGQAGNDSISGGLGNDVLTGAQDNDVIDGGAGDDLVDGGDGTDRLFGGLDSDSLIGGFGSDTLTGGGGNDFLFGGTGVDTFAYSAGDGDDWVLDFSAAGGDKMLLVGVMVSALADNVATLTDGHVVTAQSGHIWSFNHFIQAVDGAGGFQTGF